MGRKKVTVFAITACGISRETEISTVPSISSDTESGEVKEPETEINTELDNEIQTEIQSVESVQENTQQEETEMKMKIQVGDTTFTATLAENSSVDALKELMADGPSL